MSGTITHVKDIEKDGTSAVWSHLVALQGEGKQRYSPIFRVGRARWRLLIQTVNSDYGVYVECLGYDTEGDAKWEVPAHFQLETVQQQLDESPPPTGIVNWARHTFTPKTHSLGFSSQIPMKVVTDPKNSYILEDSKGRPHVEVRVTVKDHFCTAVPSKEYQGIKNQGATCYLNSLLQTLYHLNQFRNHTFALAGSTIDYSTDFKKSIPYCLSRLFYHLEGGHTSASTLALTDSFGWGRADAFEQHDVQELARKLIDTLETKMKEQSMPCAMKKMFVGKVRNYVKCVNVDFQSSKEEEYYDVQLCVRGCGSLDGSFRKELKQEILTGDNAYHAIDEHTGLDSMQEAKKGMEWLSFPPVLFLHLRRFEYDYTTDGFVKLADRFEFGEELDLTPYHQTESGRRKGGADLKYKLHSVLVHSGTVVGGHYYAFINIGGRWFKFDDTLVTQATKEEAVDDNFGGNESDERFWLNNKASGSSTSAYMLVYVRASVVGEICGKQTVIPPALLEEFRKDDKEQRERQKEKEEAYLYYSFHINTEEDFRKYDEETNGLHGDLRKPRWTDSNPLKIPKKSTYGELVAAVDNHLNRPEGTKTRLWVWCERNNDTERPFGPLVTLNTSQFPCKPITPTTPVEHIFKGDPPTESVHLYVDAGPPLKPSEILLFLKSYDPLRGTFSYAGSLTISAHKKVHHLAAKINKLHNNPPTHTLSLWEEARQSLVIPLDTQTPIQSYDITTGDIIIFYHPPEGAGVGVKPPPDAFYYMLTRKMVTISEVSNRNDTTTVEMCTHYRYADIVAAIAEAVNEPATHIRLHYMGKVLKDVDFPEVTLSQITIYGDTVQYEVLRMPLRDMQALLEVPVKHYNGVTLVKQVNLVVRKEATAGQALVEVSKYLGEGEEVDPLGLRLVKIRRRRIEMVLGHTDYLRFHVDGDVTFHSDTVTDQPPSSPTVAVCHVERQWPGHHILNMHSTPFLSHISPTETTPDLLTRFAKTMNVTKEARLKGWKLLLIYVKRGREVAIAPLEGPVLPCIQRALHEHGIHEPLDVFKQNYPITVMIGIEHRDESRRTGERGVEIKG